MARLGPVRELLFQTREQHQGRSVFVERLPEDPAVDADRGKNVLGQFRHNFEFDFLGALNSRHRGCDFHFDHG